MCSCTSHSISTPNTTPPLIGEILPDLAVRFVSIPMLIQMKEAAGRPRDIDDIQHLKWLQEQSDDE